MTRMNLNTFARHGVFADRELTDVIAARLRDASEIARARVFPYQLLAAYRALAADVPAACGAALEDAMELAIAQRAARSTARSTSARTSRARWSRRSPATRRQRHDGDPVRRRRGARDGGAPAAQPDGGGAAVRGAGRAAAALGRATA